MSEPSSKQLSNDSSHSFRVGALMYFRDESGRLLLIRRERQPNKGLWCAVGGKLKMASGESPYECAAREAAEEVGIEFDHRSLDLLCILSEKDYEDTGHWLMFVFQVAACLDRQPEAIGEGEFRFFESEELAALEMPALDRRILKEYVQVENNARFSVLRVNEGGGRDPEKLVVEESFSSCRTNDIANR